MICDPCRAGGRENAVRNTLKWQTGAYDEGCKVAAEALHARCEAPTTCPCQHRTGQLVKGT